MRTSTRYLNCGRRPDPNRKRQVEECAGRLTVGAYLAGDAPPDVGRLRLVETRLHREGRRRWFQCPGCSRRCGILYQPARGARWKCRTCHQLSYRSAQHAHRDELLWPALARIDRHIEANGGRWGDPEALFAGLNYAQGIALSRALLHIDRGGLERRIEAARNAAAVALLDRWEAEGDEDDQRETMETLRAALGPDRVASSRPLFP